MKTTIDKQKLLLVEGKDEEVFFKILLREKNINDIQIISCGGKEQFKEKFPIILRTPDFDKLTSLAITQDADQDVNGTFKRIHTLLKNNKLNPPRKIGEFDQSNSLKIGIFIIPDGKNKGNLESLCLSTVESEDIMECIESFMKCAKEKSNANSEYKYPKNSDKARCRAFLSVMEKDTPSLGVAAEKGYWNLNSEKLIPLLNFLKKI